MNYSDIPLGKPTEYVSEYSPQLLFSIARSNKRAELPENLLKFNGEDIWNAYELSWLSPSGVPRVAVAEIRVSAASPNIIESKSLKLYFNSFNQTQFKSMQNLREIMIADLSRAAGTDVEVMLQTPEHNADFEIQRLEGHLLDNLDITIEDYSYQPSLLENSIDQQHETHELLVSHLLKSNCLITSQPDWASIQIGYKGPQISHAALLRYLISFRSHNEFHEQCVERIFTDIKLYCKPTELTVYARYTRRGGLDINPWRSDRLTTMPNVRLVRQ